MLTKIKNTKHKQLLWDVKSNWEYVNTENLTFVLDGFLYYKIPPF